MSRISSRWRFAGACAVTVIVGGCARTLPPASLPEPRPLGSDLRAYEAPASSLEGEASSAAPSSAATEPTGALTLRDALALALERNPELASFSWEVRVREAEAIQAGLRPNPELAIEVENFAGSGEFRRFDSTETTLQLGQLVELAGKRLKRQRVARLEHSLAGWDYEVRRLDVLTQTTVTFVGVLSAQERVALAEDVVRLSEAAADAVAKQVAAGATSPIERTRAEVAAATARVELERATAELSAARTTLSATWGSSRAVFDRAEGDLDMIEPPPSIDDLEARIEHNPDLARWVQEVELRQAVLDLERARRVPDLEVGPGVRRLSESNDTALVFGMGVPLPLFDRNQGASLAALRDLTKARHERHAAEVGAGAALRAVHESLRASFAEASALRDRILPQAEAAYDGLREGYLRGLFRYVEVLDAQRTLFELRGREVDALRDYHSAVAEIERLTGSPLRSDADGSRGGQS